MYRLEVYIIPESETFEELTTSSTETFWCNCKNIQINKNAYNINT